MNAGLNRLLASPLRNLAGGIIYMLLVVALATIAYSLAGWSVGDAFYMVVLTVYTVGYDEVRAIDTPTLRAITICTIVLGCTGMIFLTGALVQFITIGQLQQVLGIRRMQSQIDRLTGHVIVCGFGRIGVMLTRDLAAAGMAFIVIERDPLRWQEARDLGYLCLQADATDEAALSTAGIARAICLASVLPADAANVFITLSARGLNPGLRIIARGEMPSTEGKLLQAGAAHVVLPTHISAERIAELLLHPHAVELLEDTPRKQHFLRDLHLFGLELEVVAAGPGSRCVGRTVAAVERDGAGSFWVVALERKGGETIARPPPETVIQSGDGVVIVGRPGRAPALAAAFAVPARRAGVRG